jgi:hypothetical protein
MSAAEALLSRIIDYAGLFPPATLDMETAVRNYQQYLGGDYAWMLSNFVLPASRLTEFGEAFNTICCGEQEQPWTLSVVCSGDNPPADLKAMEDFQEGAAFIAAVEFKPVHLRSAQAILAALPRGRPRYVEMPPDRAGSLLPALAASGARAKLRTGGLAPAAIPSSRTVARFLLECAEAHSAFKATAGLHHAVRGERKLSYDPGSPAAVMHGFLNVFLAAALAYYGSTENGLLETLDETDPTAFQLDDDLITWHDHRMTSDQIERVRADFAIGFGSCSFTEPIDDLKAMEWL